MARAGRKDRGLLSKLDSAGKVKWYARLYHEGKEKRFGPFKDKTEARNFYNKAKLEQLQGRFFPERYQGGGYDFLSSLLDRHTATSKVKNHWAERHYAEWWKKRFPGRRINTITAASLEEAMRGLASEKLAPQTILHYMKFLRHVFNIAVRDGKLERNPFVKVTLPKVRTGRTRFLSLDEERRLLEKLGPAYAPWARLAILTGMRQGEQFGLKWQDLDLDRGFITLPDTKAGMVQYVHLNEEAKSILRGRQAVAEAEAIADPRKRSQWVFPSENRATAMDPRNLYIRIYLPAVEAAELKGITWHALRHTFASRLAMTGKAESTIAALLRHSTTTLVKRYAHLSPSHLKEAVEGLADFGKEEKVNDVSKEVQTRSVSSPTVSQTGTAPNSVVEESTQVVDEIGAGDGI
jgi:site-specific recombinase XerD